MTRTKITLLCLPLALGGAAAVAHGHARVVREERALAELGREGKAEGDAFAATLRGDHAERQRRVYDARRELALSLAGARRDRLLGVLAVAAAAILAAALLLLRRIAGEIEEDRRNLGAQDALTRSGRP